MSAPTAKRSALHNMSRGRRRALVLVMQLGIVAYALTFAFSGTDSCWDVVLVLCLQVLYMVIFSRFLRPVMKEVIKKPRISTSANFRSVTRLITPLTRFSRSSSQPSPPHRWRHRPTSASICPDGSHTGISRLCIYSLWT